MTAHTWKRVAVLTVAGALTASLSVVPAYAITDTALEDLTWPQSDSQIQTIDDLQLSDADSIPDNPTQELPSTVSEDVPDDATVVSPELAVNADGEVQNIETGETVTDPELVGTQSQQPDPLAKTDGESFIPVQVAEVRQKVDEADSDMTDDSVDGADDTNNADGAVESSTSSTEGTVQLAALGNNQYGAYWGTYNGSAAFFESDGTLFVQQAKGVVDVSEWQGTIDWQAAKNDGVEGAIIRISYGAGNGLDEQAKRNISECKRLGIPFGIYTYSYAYNNELAADEGDDIVSLLKQVGVSPSDLSYPVYYDLENWTWAGHKPPTSPSVYDGIVNTWYAKLQAAGYTNLGVYSYTSYLKSALNSSSIHAKTTWVASYGERTNFGYPTNSRGWQYTSIGAVDGISGIVDLNAFGVREYAISYPTGTGYYVSNRLEGGAADYSFQYGKSSDVVLSGDWNGDRKDSLAIRRGNRFLVKNALCGGNAEIDFLYGKASDIVLVGDWDGDSIDTLAVRRGALYYFKNTIDGGIADKVIPYGKNGDDVLVGDWDGDGVDTLAVRRGAIYYFKNSISAGAADVVIAYGKSNDVVLVGDWDGDGVDTLAVRRGATYYIKNSISSGVADKVFAYGRTADSVLVGDWNGDNKDTFIVRR
ncbi:glycoside hydrolase family 25 protein [Bifidobacterium eulemuris]|uniref:1,4-beta-N-acetylmuramidase n=1 Tax=Bifidobacterium eulemuris TaxID=1765219 RepID=A0A261FYU5_9BIFI|nr:glycoside hydrolase family 25 protein [Bifidobacterium eulemuris]OZG64362.1 1,4-beta-N-acetylmuramidase [Bifidobacterium eulemuris]QOL32437.1 glycosyl hydrolase family 25 [Bifidobacterium eulemuris]